MEKSVETCTILAASAAIVFEPPDVRSHPAEVGIKNSHIKTKIINLIPRDRQEIKVQNDNPCVKWEMCSLKQCG